jgi:hypothetical protein
MNKPRRSLNLARSYALAWKRILRGSTSPVLLNQDSSMAPDLDIVCVLRIGDRTHFKKSVSSKTELLSIQNYKII